MPDRAEILSGLAAVSNEHTAAAITWHIAFGAALLALAAGWRPSNRTAGMLLATPLASVSVVAFLAHNPFNGAMFAALFLALVLLSAIRADDARVAAGPWWSVGLGIGMLAFGWVYPHFLEARSPIEHLYAAPLGLIPCPTLSAVLGVALLARGLHNRGWSTTLASASALYAAFGIVRLGVWIDAALLVGALALLLAVSHSSPVKNARSARPLPTG